MAELATGYVSIVAQTGGMQKAISDALRDATKNIPDGPGRSIGDRLSAGLTKGLKVGAVAAGGAIAATLGTAVAKGFSRLSNIDQAEAKLAGLGNSAEDVAAIMDSANASVRGTAFGLDEAATTAASAVAAGIKPGKDLQRTLSLMGDAATIAGTDMSTMGSIVNKVATSDMMQMDVANQMMDAGIPILQMVADEMGVTADEARKMASDGKVSFDTFQNALETGLGGAALKSGDTFKGSLANMGAALGRFGATLIGPIFDNAPAVFAAIGDAFDLMGEKVGPLAEQFGEWLAPKMENFANNIGPMLETSIENISNFVAELWEKLNLVADWYSSNSGWINSIAAAIGAAATAWALWTGAIKTWNAITTIATKIQTIFNKVVAANKIMMIVTAISAVVAGLTYFFTQTETGQRIWESFTQGLASAWEWVTEKFSAGIEWITDAFGGLFDLVVKGDFTGALRDAFGWEEDNAFVNGILTVRDILTGIPDLITGITDILFKGDFTGLPFGLEEDSGFVGFLFTVRDAVVSAGDFIKRVFDTIWQVAQVTLGVIGTVVLTPLLLAWQALSWGVQWYWENQLKPVVDAFAAAGKWLWENALQPALSGIEAGWNWLVGVLQAGWTVISTVVINAWNSYWANVQNNFAIVTGALMTAWNWLRDIFLAAWTFIKTLVVDAFTQAWNNLQSNFNMIMGLISGAWNLLKDGLYAGWAWIDENVLGGFRRGMDAFKGFFESVVDGIKTVWDGLRSALAKPINFMINTVYNDGILRAWNTIAGFLPGLDTASPLAGIPERAEGGSIFGPGTETSDSILARLSNNEHVWTAREVRRAGGHGNIYAMRALIDSRIPFTFDGHGQLVPLPARPNNRAGDLYGAAPELLPAFKTGGAVTPLWEHQLIAAHKFAQSQSGKPYQWAGPNGPNSSFDCSGFMGSIAATIQGDNPWQRYWATMSFPSPGAQGFVSGLGPGFSVGIFNGGPYGGHTAGTLGPAGPYGSVNVESGGSPSRVKYGPGAVGADHSQFTMQYHLPIGADGAFVSGGGGGLSPEAMMDGIKKKISDLIDKAMNPILNLLPEGPPEWLNIPKGAYDKGKEGLLDGAFELVGKLGDSLASVWTAAGQVNELVTGTVRDAASWVNRTVRDVFVRDQGGIVPHGAAAVNTSGKDELMLPPSATQAFLNSVPIWHELSGAWQGIDFGYAATADVVGDKAAIKMLNGVESIGTVAKELSVAYRGGDWGYGELSRYVGDEFALGMVNGVARLGEAVRRGELDLGAPAVQARQSAEDYAVENASSMLKSVGLEGLVPLAVKAGAQAWDNYQASPFDVAPQGQTIVIEYSGDESDREWRLLNKLQSEVDWLKAKRRPGAGARTRGGVM